MNIFSELNEKGNNGSDAVAFFVRQNPQALNLLVENMFSENKRIKNAAAKSLKILSETDPALLYNFLEKFHRLFRAGDTILKWIAIDIVGNLSLVDYEDKIGVTVLNELVDLLSDESMITANHAIESLGKIAANKQPFRDQIAQKLLLVEIIPRNEECTNILLGKLFQVYTSFFDKLTPELQTEILALVKRQGNNSRNATRKKAEQFAKMFD